MFLSALRSAFVPADLDWLALRFKYDSNARHTGLESYLVKNFIDQDLRILDLGCGSAANVLHLSSALTEKQHWTLVDRDAVLLQQVAVNLQPFLESVAPNATYEILAEDFYRAHSQCFTKTYDLVVANAVFDLSSLAQFRRLICTLKRTQPKSTILYFTLNLDMDLRFFPADPHDNLAQYLFHKHMCRPQYFGRAMGPRSAKLIASTLKSSGYHVKTRPSPWAAHMDPHFIEANLDFMANSRADFAEATEENLLMYDAWLMRRREQNHRGQLSLFVGHQDIYAERL